jgi:transposase-like protein
MYERRGQGVTMHQIAQEPELRPEQLRVWANQLGGRPGVGAVESPEQELRRLRREVDRLRQERDWAKKSRCTSRRSRGEVRLYRSPRGRVSPATPLRRRGRESWWILRVAQADYTVAAGPRG